MPGSHPHHFCTPDCAYAATIMQWMYGLSSLHFLILRAFFLHPYFPSVCPCSSCFQPYSLHPHPSFSAFPLLSSFNTFLCQKCLSFPLIFLPRHSQFLFAPTLLIASQAQAPSPPHHYMHIHGWLFLTYPWVDTSSSVTRFPLDIVEMGRLIMEKVPGPKLFRVLKLDVSFFS